MKLILNCLTSTATPSVVKELGVRQPVSVLKVVGVDTPSNVQNLGTPRSRERFDSY